MPIKLNTPQDWAAARTVRKELLDKQLLGSMGSDAVLGLGVGASAVGAHRLLKLLVGNLQKKEPVQDVTSLHIGGGYKRPEDKKSKKKTAVTDKQANIFQEIFGGRAASSAEGLPYGRTGRVAALLAGLGAGAWGTNKLLGNVKGQIEDRELAQARREFQAALHGEHPVDDSVSSEEDPPKYKLAAALTRLEKAASICGEPKLAALDKRAGEQLASGVSNALGLYALMAMISGGTAGYYGYKAGKKQQKGRQYELAYKAKKQRQRQQDPLSPVVVSDLPEEQTHI